MCDAHLLQRFLFLFFSCHDIMVVGPFVVRVPLLSKYFCLDLHSLTHKTRRPHRAKRSALLPTRLCRSYRGCAAAPKATLRLTFASKARHPDTPLPSNSCAKRLREEVLVRSQSSTHKHSAIHNTYAYAPIKPFAYYCLRVQQTHLTPPSLHGDPHRIQARSTHIELIEELFAAGLCES
eukprot:gene615-338_t